MKILSLTLRILVITVLASFAKTAFAALETLPLVSIIYPSDFSSENIYPVFAQDENGMIYLASKRGLHTFNGYNWQTYPLTKETALYSLAFHKGILYGGSFEDFGYFEPDETGYLHFRSLVSNIKDDIKQNSFENILTGENTIYFISENAIYAYDIDGKSINKIPKTIHSPVNPDSKSLEALQYSLINNGLYAQNQDLALFRFDGFGWTPVFTADCFDDEITGLVTPVNYRRSNDRIPDGTLITTHIGTVYEVSNGVPIKNISLTEKLVGDFSNAISIEGKLICVSTDNNGVFLIDKNGYTKQLTESEGLADNSVKRLYTDRDGHLWAFHERGISVVETGLPIKRLVTEDRDSFLNDRHAASFDSNGIKMMIRSSDSSLFLYQVSGDGDVKFIDEIEGFNIPLVEILKDNSHTLWGKDKRYGIYKIDLNNNSVKSEGYKFYPGLSNDSIPKDINFFKLRGKVIFCQEDQAFSYDEGKDSFMLEEKITEQLKSLFPLTHLQMIDESSFIAGNGRRMAVVKYDGDYQIVYSFSLDMNLSPYLNINESLGTDGKRIFFPLNDGIAVINKDLVEKDNKTQNLSFDFIGSFSKDGKLERLPLSNKKKPKIENGNLIVSLRCPNFNLSSYLFEFRLKGGGGSQESCSDSPEMIYRSLRWGNYKLECSVYDIDGEKLGEIHYDFEVISPWPLRWWAWLCYIGVAAVLIFLVSRYFSKRLIDEKNKRLEREKQRQNKMIKEQAMIIANQEKRIQADRLSSKSVELAELPLSSETRQQTIDFLRESISFRRKIGKKISEDEKILKEISGAMTDHRLFWDIYYKNFNLIYEAYFNRLKTAYPTLSPADLKFCGLLKMGLSSKEISKFTGLTLRGVETARYRIRKKLDLDKDKSLTEFLKTFS